MVMGVAEEVLVKMASPKVPGVAAPMMSKLEASWLVTGGATYRYLACHPTQPKPLTSHRLSPIKYLKTFIVYSCLFTKDINVG